MELKKLKIKRVKRLDTTNVNDLTVADTQHYITENGVINHNTGPEYAASIILFLGKAQLTDGSGNKKVKSGIIVKIAPNKNRFAKPNVVKTFIRYDSGMNPYVGLEEYFDWNDVGIAKGKIEKGEVILKKTSKTWVAKHLDESIEKASELYSSKVFTKKVLDAIDEKIKPLFSYGINDDIPDDLLGAVENEIEDLLDETSKEADAAIKDIN